MRTIRAAGATEREIRTVDTEAEGAWQMGVKVAKISALIVPIAGIAMQVSFLVVLGVGGYRVATGAITVANLVAFILFLFMMILPLGQAFGAITSVNLALGALGRIQEILDLPDEDAYDRELAPLALMVGDANDGVLPDAPAIEFDDVHFAYAATRQDPADPGNDSPDEHLPEPDVTTASRCCAASRSRCRAGSASRSSARRARASRRSSPSSSASTTRASARCAWAASTCARSTARELRAQIGYVEQDAPVLAGTLRDNLKLGSPDATDAECEQVLRAVNLGGVLDRDPAGLDAAVGEDGIMLSGGERQRLAIARALLSAPPILLLDESTSSLDGVNERMMREAIDAVSDGRTLIVIAHRLSTVIDSDRIVVVDDGRVIGEGTHAELVASVPLYRDSRRTSCWSEPGGPSAVAAARESPQGRSRANLSACSDGRGGVLRSVGIPHPVPGCHEPMPPRRTTMTIATVSNAREHLAHSTNFPSTSSTTCRTPTTTPGRPRRRGTASATRSTASRPASRAGSATGSRCVCPRSPPCATRCPRATADAARCGPRRRSPTAPCASPRASTTRRTARARPLSWSRNWASVAVLPPARDAGRLYYRFRVSSRLVLDGQASTQPRLDERELRHRGRRREGEPVRGPGLRDPDRPPARRRAGPRGPGRLGVAGVRGLDRRAPGRHPGDGVRDRHRPAVRATAGCACTRGRAPGSAPTEPGASGTIEFRYAPAAMLRLIGRLDEPHGDDAADAS